MGGHCISTYPESSALKKKKKVAKKRPGMSVRRTETGFVTLLWPEATWQEKV